MTDFGSALLRLKQHTGAHKDKEIAELLGLSDKAFNARKARGAFPEDKLFTLASKRSDLAIDPSYILLGIDSAAHAQARATSAISSFPARLRVVRGGRSVAQFAALIGVAPSELRELEQGSRRPSTAMIERYIAAHPDASVTWLVGGERPQLDVPLDDVEIIMIRNYRVATLEDQEMLRSLAALSAKRAAQPAASTSLDVIKKPHAPLSTCSPKSQTAEGRSVVIGGDARAGTTITTGGKIGTTGAARKAARKRA